MLIFFGEKKKGGQTSGWACTTRAKFQGLSLEHGVDIWPFVRKNE